MAKISVTCSNRPIAIIVIIYALIIGNSALISAQSATPQRPIDPLRNANISAMLTSSKPDPALGEPFTMMLSLDLPTNADLLEFPRFPEEAYPFQAIAFSEIAETVTASGKRYEQAIQLVVWEHGTHVTPEMRVSVRLGGDIITAPIQSASVQVMSLLSSTDDRDLRPPLAPRDLWYVPHWIWVGVIVLLSTLIWVFWRILNRGTHGVRRALNSSPSQMAIAQLEDLQAQHLADTVIYAMVAQSLRDYLQQQYRLAANEMTTPELMQQLKTLNLPNALTKRLHQILEQGDLVKFARFEPEPQSGTRLIKLSLLWLRHMEQHLATVAESADHA